MPYSNPEDVRAAGRRHYHKYSEYYKEKNRQKREKVREFLYRYKRLGVCARCGKNPHHAAMQFHHRDPATKLAGIADMVNRRCSLKKIKEEIRKCDLLCANCHAIVEYAPVV